MAWVCLRGIGVSSSYLLMVRHSDFQSLMNDEFGAEYAAVLLRDLALIEFNDLTGNKA